MLVILYERLSNDRNGNPRFFVRAFFNGHDIAINTITKEKLRKKRNLKGYIVTTYNISNIFKELIKYFNLDDNEFQIIEL